jgi:hypothetical protein
MSASVNLWLGNLFDGPTDLIVLPCSTAGTVSEFVANSFKHYRLPQQSAWLKLDRSKMKRLEAPKKVV